MECELQLFGVFHQRSGQVTLTEARKVGGIFRCGLGTLLFHLQLVSPGVEEQNSGPVCSIATHFYPSFPLHSYYGFFSAQTVEGA